MLETKKQLALEGFRRSNRLWKGFGEKSGFLVPRNAGPTSEVERRYCDMIVRFLELMADRYHPRRTRALAGELDRVEIALGERARELDEWTFAIYRECQERAAE